MLRQLAEYLKPKLRRSDFFARMGGDEFALFFSNIEIDEAEKIVQGYIQQGNEAKAKILKEAEATAEKLQLQAKRNIEHEFSKARQELQKEVVEKSLVKAEELLKQTITDKDQDKLVNEYLDKVVA